MLLVVLRVTTVSIHNVSAARLKMKVTSTRVLSVVGFKSRLVLLVYLLLPIEGVTTVGLESVKERLVHYKKNEAVFIDKINILNPEAKLRDNVLAKFTKNFKKAEKERNELKLILEKLRQENRSDKIYHAVSLPFTGNYMPSKRDLRLIDEHIESVYVDVISNIAPSDVRTVKTIDVNYKCVFSTEEPKPIMKNNFSPPIIEDWHSDNESEEEISSTVEVKIVKPSVEKIKYVKPAKETVKTEESPKQQKHHPRGNQRN
uniref:Uncharacterized protein n=1 Tax=Tanacetum cinerariifolium TaxID=118510 RepID=A0A6L2M3V4_TANCI|nr:hypothetical protein [Tanacetum cinerariifolium]